MTSAANITFIRPKSIGHSAEFIYKKIAGQLDAGKKVLWLLSGGSAISLAVETAKLLQNNPHLNNLIVTLADERWGTPGHPDSNWEQIQKAGFELREAILQPVLDGGNLGQTLKTYTELLQKDLQETDYKIAIAGIGPDGHTFGIKPGSPAVGSKDLSVGFKWNDYSRLTPTAEFIRQLDEVIVYAFGAEKRSQLEDLEKDLPLNDQPAQALKLVNKVTVLNDFKGDEL